jgi:hypothetical protein
VRKPAFGLLSRAKPQPEAASKVKFTSINVSIRDVPAATFMCQCYW